MCPAALGSFQRKVGFKIPRTDFKLNSLREKLSGGKILSI